MRWKMQWQCICSHRNKEVVFYMGQGSIIGYEINEKTCQISFYNDEELEPDTLEVDSDNYQIPLIIGKLRDTWRMAKRQNGLSASRKALQ